jgi:hypothetical protein
LSKICAYQDYSPLRELLQHALQGQIPITVLRTDQPLGPKGMECETHSRLISTKFARRRGNSLKEGAFMALSIVSGISARTASGMMFRSLWIISGPPEFWGEVQPPASLKRLDIPSRRAVFVP